MKERDAPLWVDLSNNTTFEGLRWVGLSKIVARWRRQAGIEKEFTGYTFRHTRLTNLASWMTEAQMCVFAGWEIGSKMPRMYVHLAGRDVDDALLKSYGLKKAEDFKAPRAPRKCVRCGTVSNAEAELCSKCGVADAEHCYGQGRGAAEGEGSTGQNAEDLGPYRRAPGGRGSRA